jgi:hypothetical protein
MGIASSEYIPVSIIKARLSPNCLDDIAEVMKNESKDNPRRVSEANLRKFHQSFIDINPNTDETHEWDAAKAMFRNNQVSRKAIRDLRGPQKRGRKPTEPRNKWRYPRIVMENR